MSAEQSKSKGSLTVVGTGMKFKSHMTLETIEAIQQSEKVYYNVADIMTEKWLEELNPRSERLPSYFPNRSRLDTYNRWVELILSSVRQGLQTCAASYGHSGVFAYFARTAIRIARGEGYKAIMLPGISAEACLICDLLVDPAEGGWQSYGATDFIKRKPAFDTRSHLILLQIRVVDWPGLPDEIHREGLQHLSEYMVSFYGNEHKVVIYRASRNSALDPEIQNISLNKLAKARFRGSATLYVPPLRD